MASLNERQFNNTRKDKAQKDVQCEVCWAKLDETPLYRHGGAVYCEQDLNRAINEKWHPGSKKITEIKR